MIVELKALRIQLIADSARMSELALQIQEYRHLIEENTRFKGRIDGLYKAFHGLELLETQPRTEEAAARYPETIKADLEYFFKLKLAARKTQAV